MKIAIVKTMLVCVVFYVGIQQLSAKDTSIKLETKTSPQHKPLEISKAIRNALFLRFRWANNSTFLYLVSGIKNAPVNVAFTVYGKRERGSGDWEAFYSFCCNAGRSTNKYGYIYKHFVLKRFTSGLKGGQKYRFKFKFVPNKNESKNAYYKGVIETGCMELQVPKRIYPADVDNAAVTVTRPHSAGAWKRNDQLFRDKCSSFKIDAAFGKEYWIGRGGFFNNFVNITIPKSNSKTPVSTLWLAEINSVDDYDKKRTIYNISAYYQLKNVDFQICGGDTLFPEPGAYRWDGKIYCFSMSGEDMLNEDIVDTYGRTLLLPAGVYNPKRGPKLLKRLQKKYPFHTISLLPAEIKAVH